mmetsp:Transcript_28807/g.75915  ORF Transcript_28807/g.75915 Transcript_28807/m.75915 type:complete len:582 (-) Transcript_28807:69-1814(-)
MAQASGGRGSEELQVRDGEFPSEETPLETAWTFWCDKKTADKKESDQYLESLRQLGSFNTIEGFYRHYSYLLRPSDLPRDHNVLLFRKGYKPMWEEFPDGGCWIIRIKRKVSVSYVNRMWEHLLMACIGESFEMPDVVGCVLSTRYKDDVLSIWNISNRNSEARFRIGEMLKQVLDLDMNALIQYKDHMQSLQDYSTFRNAKNYMFAPSPNVTPASNLLDSPAKYPNEHPVMDDLDELLPPAAIDTNPDAFEGNSFDAQEFSFSNNALLNGTAKPPKAASRTTSKSPALAASAPPFVPPRRHGAPSPKVSALGSASMVGKSSPKLSASATPFSPSMSASAPPFSPGVQGGTSSAVSSSYRESSARNVANGVVGRPLPLWEFAGDNGWQPFAGNDTTALEVAYSAKSSSTAMVLLGPNRTEFEVNFIAMTQRDPKTDWRRGIRRQKRDPDAEQTGSAAWGKRQGGSEPIPDAASWPHLRSPGAPAPGPSQLLSSSREQQARSWGRIPKAAEGTESPAQPSERQVPSDEAGAWGRVSKPDPAEASVGPEAGEPQSRVFSYAAAAARGAAKSKSGKGAPVPKAA